MRGPGDEARMCYSVAVGPLEARAQLFQVELSRRPDNAVKKLESRRFTDSSNALDLSIRVGPMRADLRGVAVLPSVPSNRGAYAASSAVFLHT